MSSLRRFAVSLALSVGIPAGAWAASPERAQPVPTRESPVEAVDLGGGHWFVDFGKAAFGNIEINDAELRSPAKITVFMGEARSGEHSVNRNPGGTVRYQSHEMELKPRVAGSPKLTWKAPGFVGDSYIALAKGMPEVMPFRYVEIEGAPDSFAKDDIVRVSWAVPFEDSDSAFESTDPHLGAVWDLCKHSIKATSFLGIYVDGDRERRAYAADALINQLSHYAVDDHYETSRRTTAWIIETPTWPTEWHLQTVMLAWNDFLWSGDDRLIRAHYDALKRYAMIDRRTEDGLFRGFMDGDPRDIVDWPAGERDGYDMSLPVKSAVTAFHYRALVLLGRIATELGKTSDAAKFAELARATREAFNRELWDEEHGCYVDGLDASGNKSQHASAHANFFPLALGLVPDDRKAQVGRFLKDKGMACSVYGAQFLLEALYEAGEDEAALKLMTSDSLRSWRNMSEKVGSTVTLEAWDPSLKPNLDWNHAWGAAPANIISRKLMGIEPLEPGFELVSIRPQTGGLERATIKAPTPKGPISLRVEDSKERGKVDLILPAGVSARLLLPRTGAFTVANGPGSAKPQVLGEENGRTELGLTPGRWTLVQP